jgi:hypothetical protein
MRRCDEKSKQSTINSCHAFGRFGSSTYLGNTFFFLCVSSAAFTASTNTGSARASLMWLLSREGLTASAARGQSMGGDKQYAQGERTKGAKGEKGRDKLPPVSAICYFIYILRYLLHLFTTW